MSLLSCVTNHSRSDCAVWFCMQQKLAVALCPFPARFPTVLLSDPGAAYVKALLIPEWLPLYSTSQGTISGSCLTGHISRKELDDAVR